jgi:hypothetical protein
MMGCVEFTECVLISGNGLRNQCPLRGGMKTNAVMLLPKCSKPATIISILRRVATQRRVHEGFSLS